MAASKLLRNLYRRRGSSTTFHCLRAYWNELPFPSRGKSSHLTILQLAGADYLDKNTHLWVPEFVPFKV